MFIQNKYTKYYLSIISKALLREKLSCYVESHHIMPKSLGGTGAKTNMVDLTGREHYICHLLLTKMVEGKAKQKMLFAFILMSTHGKNKNGTSRGFKKLNSRMFCSLRKDFARAMSDSRTGQSIFSKTPKETAAKRSAALKGRVFSDETRRKMSESAKIRKRGLCSESHKQHISDKLTGVKKTKEHRHNLSLAKIGSSPRIVTLTVFDIEAISPDNDIIVECGISVKDFSEKYKLNQSSVRNSCLRQSPIKTGKAKGWNIISFKNKTSLQRSNT